MPYLSEVERGRKEASSEVLAAAAQALGLGLGDLLSRVHGELTRVTSRYGRAAAPARPAPAATGSAWPPDGPRAGAAPRGAGPGLRPSPGVG